MPSQNDGTPSPPLNDLPGVPKRGLFIAIEGIDGSGKSTLATSLAKLLWGSTRPAATGGDCGPDICLTREPYDPIPPGHTRGRIREALMAPSESKVDPAQLAIMFAADRFAHLEDVVTPALTRGETVVCDRYKLSTIAYQTLKLPEDFVFRLVAPAPSPDITVLLDMDPEVSMARLIARGLPLESYERSLDTQIELRERYLYYITKREYYGTGSVIIVPAGVTAKLKPDTLARYVRQRVHNAIHTTTPPDHAHFVKDPENTYTEAGKRALLASEVAIWAEEIAGKTRGDKWCIYNHPEIAPPGKGTMLADEVLYQKNPTWAPVTGI